MKKETKKKIKKIISKSLSELALAFIFLISGAIVAMFFSLDIKGKLVSFETLLFLGFACLLVAAVIVFVLRFIAKKRGKKSTNQDEFSEDRDD